MCFLFAFLHAVFSVGRCVIADWCTKYDGHVVPLFVPKAAHMRVLGDRNSFTGVVMREKNKICFVLHEDSCCRELLGDYE